MQSSSFADMGKFANSRTEYLIEPPGGKDGWRNCMVAHQTSVYLEAGLLHRGGPNDRITPMASALANPVRSEIFGPSLSLSRRRSYGAVVITRCNPAASVRLAEPVPWLGESGLRRI